MAMIPLLALVLQTQPVAPAPQAPVTLARVMKKGEIQSYQVKANLVSETRSGNLDTFLPSEETVDYGFTLSVLEEKADGIVRTIYRRPYMIVTEGETFESPEVRHKMPVNWNLELLLSPTNEVLDVKDLSKPKPKPKKKSQVMTGSFMGNSSRPQLNIMQFVAPIQELAMFVGDFDAGMDFNPKLPFTAVKVGKSWKKTVGYSPQRLKGSKESAMQRLDYTFTYDGLGTWNGKKVHLISAVLDVNTDAGEFINQMIGMKPDQSGLKKFMLQLNAKIQYRLDATTCATLSSHAESTGSAKLDIAGMDNAAYEVKFTGKCDLTLTGVKKAAK